MFEENTQLLQNMEKLCTNYPRLQDRLKKQFLKALYIVIQKSKKF